LPKISIVTPSYNQGKYIEATIQSILSQQYPNLEYIIIDGASTDNSLEIIQQYAGRLSYWESQPDRGFGHAINKGFKKATGEILCWINSDDILLPGALLCIGKYFATHPEVGLAFGDRHFIKEDSTLLFKKRFFLFVPGQLRHAKTLPQESTFWRRSVFEKAGAFLDEDLTFAIDLDLWCRLARVTRITHIPIFLGAIRVHPKSKSSTTRTVGRAERNKIIEKYYGHFPSQFQVSVFRWWMTTVRRFYKFLRFDARKRRRIIEELNLLD